MANVKESGHKDRSITVKLTQEQHEKLIALAERMSRDTGLSVSKSNALRAMLNNLPAA
ncbi:hypothetical protein GR173_004691 [Salmonella enterica subsp. enterica]|nr:hypothetical protein [Salmonella enterica subsp. enterica serovar Belfast]EDW4633116.1 hypothetical protein [Salmonella enterica subsp. enterica]EEF0877438.1 hypothetical protein [Salmonella enterica subsp. enterica serovar Tafo]EEL0258263.1 hypothetical protein [Salmonella enterica]EGI5715112.1 hypothetical protein [Salmonella enterica subsp. enterica serovar Durham]EIH3027318.1 hypothetical protein [Salmonella enterica subsp. enterica serovar Telelkebir]EIR2646764.1 hypothetical protein 